ncbi:lipocalin-like domain-containing protein [Alsobacter sp. SYSU BS001988]
MSSSPVGVWRLRSFDLADTVTGEKRQPFGAHPQGCLVLHPCGRMIGVLTPSGRPIPVTIEEKVAAFDAMYAYSGMYRLEGDTGEACCPANLSQGSRRTRKMQSSRDLPHSELNSFVPQRRARRTATPDPLSNGKS